MLGLVLEVSTDACAEAEAGAERLVQRPAEVALDLLAALAGARDGGLVAGREVAEEVARRAVDDLQIRGELARAAEDAALRRVRHQRVPVRAGETAEEEERGSQHRELVCGGEGAGEERVKIGKW